MAFQNGFLTQKQFRIWDLFRKGTRQSAIARKLKITRQATNLTLNQAHLKMNRALTAAAKLHNLQIDTLNPDQGFVTGYSPQARTKITILYTLQHGLQTWYHHDAGECQDCPELTTCITTLKQEAKRREITLTKKEQKQQPGQLAETIFTKIKQNTKT